MPSNLFERKTRRWVNSFDETRFEFVHQARKEEKRNMRKGEKKDQRKLTCRV